MNFKEEKLEMLHFFDAEAVFSKMSFLLFLKRCTHIHVQFLS